MTSTELMRRWLALVNACGREWRIYQAIENYSWLFGIFRYCEIGVLDGQATKFCVKASPLAELWLFDLWSATEYAGKAKPSKGTVDEVLALAGHRGRRHYIENSSTFPAQNFAPGFFDVIIVDGDHHPLAARRDLDNVADTVKQGGIIVFDDLHNPGCEQPLEPVWDAFMAAQGDAFLSAKCQFRWGTAMAMRAK